MGGEHVIRRVLKRQRFYKVPLEVRSLLYSILFMFISSYSAYVQDSTYYIL